MEIQVEPESQMLKKQRKSSKDDIVKVFSNLVARNGYNEASIAEVSKALGISKGTVVHHFNSKIDILEFVHLQYMMRRTAEAQHIIGSLPTPTGQLCAMIYALVKSHRDDRDATIAFLREFQRFPKFSGAVRTLRDSYTLLVTGIIQRGINQGEFCHDSAMLVAMQIFGMCNYAWTWYRPEGPMSAEEIAKGFSMTVLMGLKRENKSNEIDAIIEHAQRVVEKFAAEGSFASRIAGDGFA